MLKDKLAQNSIILASASPRRQKFFEDLGIQFKIRLKEVEENYPAHLNGADIPRYLAQLKAAAFRKDLLPKEILITSDTIVWHNNVSLGKPKNELDAREMLRQLSGDRHQVITAVCFTNSKIQTTVHDITEVYFTKLDEDQIDYYLRTCRPFDKAGAYGIQDWIGLIGIERIEGSYYNVMGLPTHLVYKTLIDMAG